MKNTFSDLIYCIVMYGTMLFITMLTIWGDAELIAIIISGITSLICAIAMIVVGDRLDRRINEMEKNNGK